MSDQIQAAIDAIKLGIEHTEELQSLHEIYSGRTTLPNLGRALYFEDVLKQMESALEGLKKIEVVK